MTETYSQIGNVQRAMARCCGNRALRPRDSVTSARGQHGRRQHDVRDEDREVQRPDEPLPREGHRADLRVIDEVEDQKQREVANAAIMTMPMLLDAAAPG